MKGPRKQRDFRDLNIAHIGIRFFVLGYAQGSSGLFSAKVTELKRNPNVKIIKKYSSTFVELKYYSTFVETKYKSHAVIQFRRTINADSLEAKKGLYEGSYRCISGSKACGYNSGYFIKADAG
jgi:hypothetical protein